jgi:hypothetical protein
VVTILEIAQGANFGVTPLYINVIVDGPIRFLLLGQVKMGSLSFLFIHNFMPGQLEL